MQSTEPETYCVRHVRIPDIDKLSTNSRCDLLVAAMNVSVVECTWMMFRDVFRP